MLHATPTFPLCEVSCETPPPLARRSRCSRSQTLAGRAGAAGCLLAALLLAGPGDAVAQAVQGAGGDVLTLAMYQPLPRHPAAREGLGLPAPTSATGAEDTTCRADALPGAAAHFSGSHIPNPLDNPWALGMLAGVLGLMTWAERRQRREDRARWRAQA